MSDAAFIFILVGSVGLSVGLRFCPTRWRADASAVAGAMFIVFSCGLRDAFHPLLAIGLAIICLKIMPERLHSLAAFTLAFGHLAVLRMSSSPPEGPTNAALLILVLRLAGADGAVAAGSGSGRNSSVELARFALCYHGLFTGPYYSHVSWEQMMRSPKPWPSARHCGAKLLAVLAALAVWRGTAAALPYEALWDGTATDWPGWQRYAYFFGAGFPFRWRFYACWLLMELSGDILGSSGSSNVDLIAVELATCPTAIIAGWNTSVQAWLKANVYHGLQQRSTPRPARRLAVFAVSAFWHGIRPGYYLFFLGLFAMVSVEQVVRATTPEPWFEAAAPNDTTMARGRRGVVAIVCHVWTLGCFGFFGGAFNLLRWSDTVRLWRSVDFYGVWLTPIPAACAVFQLLMPTMRIGMSGNAARERSQGRLGVERDAKLKSS